jgi:hypothetical protein
VHELDGAGYVSQGVVPLDAGVLEVMVDVSESIS